MRQIGREQDLERINRIALKIAREVADDTDTLMAGGVSNTNIYVENSPEVEERIRAMFEEQVSEKLLLVTLTAVLVEGDVLINFHTGVHNNYHALKLGFMVSWFKNNLFEGLNCKK